MALALLTATVVSILGLCISVWFGYRIPQPGAFHYHFLFAIVSALITVFSHSMTMFFFIGSGRTIREYIREHRMDESHLRQTRLFKARVFPFATAAIGLTMVVTILGGGVHTGVISVFLHAGLSYLAIASNLAALWVEAKYLAANNALLAELAR
ncbi:MAG: hypothetical protein HY652_12295 [Acidobacteria bacterium]|nr:hypothetical protein [Acidobacteriota bacterium]